MSIHHYKDLYILFSESFESTVFNRKRMHLLCQKKKHRDAIIKSQIENISQNAFSAFLETTHHCIAAEATVEYLLLML